LSLLYDSFTATKTTITATNAKPNIRPHIQHARERVEDAVIVFTPTTCPQFAQMMVAMIPDGVEEAADQKHAPC